MVNLLFGGALMMVSHQAEGWGLLYYLDLDPLGHVVASIVLLDLTFYGFHWANHIIPFLWRFQEHITATWSWTSRLLFDFTSVKCLFQC